jgi:membrane-bound lytic murein transglycosylase F
MPLARSPVGAYGLCQFMPGTAKDVGRVLKVTPDQFWLPEVSIRAAAFYMGKLSQSWKSPRPPMDRHKLALGSYNAGIGHLLKAQKLCEGRLYDEIIICLPMVTGRHSKETIDYTQKITDRWYPAMLTN